MAATTTLRGAAAPTRQRASSTFDLLIAITLRDLRVRYHGTVLAYLWWVARPLILGMVLYFALGTVLNLDVDHHAVFLLSALFPWFWFQTTVHGSTNAFLMNHGLIKKVRFERLILPVSVVLGGAIEFAVSLPILSVIVIADGIQPSWAWLAGIPLLFVLQFMLLTGLGILVATANVFFRDLGPALDSVMLLLFYVTPIIYPLSQVPEEFQSILKLNPLVPLIDAWRNVFLYGEFPGPEIWPSLLFAAIAITAGLAVHRALGRNLADAL